MSKKYDIFGYVKIKVPEGHVKLSPSGLGEFRRNPRGWYDTTILNKSSFTGNYASVQGTLLHGICEAYFIGITDGKYWELAEEYLNKEMGLGTIDFDDSRKMKKYVSDFKPVIENWLKHEDKYNLVEVESQVDYKIKRAKAQKTDFHLAGSTDAIVIDNSDVMYFAKADTEGYEEVSYEEYLKAKKAGTDTKVEGIPKYGIRDYKSSKRKISSLNSYRDQLLTYALAVSKTRDFNISFIEVVALVWNKTNGFTITSIREDIDPKVDYKGLTSLIREICRTYEVSLDNPELQPLLFRKGVDYFGKPIMD